MSLTKFALILFFFLWSQIANAASHSRILFVFAHPDDETLIRSVLMRLVEQKNEVSALYLTRGEGGTDQRWADKTPNALVSENERNRRSNELAATRHAELLKAIEVYHFKNYRQMDLADTPLRNSQTGEPTRDAQKFLSESGPWKIVEAKSKIEAIANELKPDIVITFFPKQPDTHAHHQATSELMTELFANHRLGGSAHAIYGFYENTTKDWMLPRIEFPPGLKSPVTGEAYGEMGTVGGLAHVSQMNEVTGKFIQDWQHNPNEVLAPISTTESLAPMVEALGDMPGMKILPLIPANPAHR